MIINNGLPNINIAPAQPPTEHAVTKSSRTFGELFQSMVGEVNESQLDGDQAIQNLQSGKAKHLHEVMIAVEEADVSLRMLVQMRNKALTAYEEIMRMQI
ncbi:MAG: flagellar hook-basal body complex protein FliE [Desulfobulbaceae bacterium]|nr:flagellar hook-basal body complex protein FliE [Desulfobulbaceae bacterium]